MIAALPASWQTALAPEFAASYFTQLQTFVAEERQRHEVYPPPGAELTALRLTPLERVKVVLLGQDPYHGPGQAHGLCFSVPLGVRPPPSLVNTFKELHADLGCPIPAHGNLTAWAERGVLLLNTVLTVRAHAANSHKGQGWEHFTDAVLDAVNFQPRPVVFLLWGNHAQLKAKRIDAARHRVLKAAHPSPLSATKFFGCRPFSAANRALEELGREPVEWNLTGEP